MERTLVLLKPDAVQRNLVGTILARFEQKGYKIVGLKMQSPSEALWKEHYGHLVSKPFFPAILKFMTASPLVAVVLEGAGIVDELRKMIGATNPKDALPGTIRGDFAKSIDFNIIHASDSVAAAEVEIKRFFAEGEVTSYGRELFDV